MARKQLYGEKQHSEYVMTVHHSCGIDAGRLREIIESTPDEVRKNYRNDSHCNLEKCNGIIYKRVYIPMTYHDQTRMDAEWEENHTEDHF